MNALILPQVFLLIYICISHSSIPDNVVKNISEGDEIFSF